MSKEFNPTSKDLLTLEEVLIDLRSKKSKLVTRKVQLQNSLSILKSNYATVEYNSEEFKKIKRNRQNLKRLSNDIEIEIRKVNEEISFKTKLKLEVEFHLKHNKSFEGNEELNKIANKIKTLKNKYSDFCKDRTRVSSLRVMAKEISEELEELLK